MKRSLLLTIGTALVTAAALSACGHSGGGDSASTPATGFSCDAYGTCTGTSTGYVGNGTWSGQIGIPVASRAIFQQMAAQTGMCYGQRCAYVASHMSVRLQLRSNGGYYNNIPGYPQTQTGITTQASVRLSVNGGGRFSRSNAVVSGNTSAFAVLAPLYTSGYPYAQPTTTTNPTVQINGQWTDASQTSLNVQVLFNGQQVATGQIYGQSSAPYGYTNSGYYQSGGYIGGAYTSNAGYISGTVIGGGPAYIPFTPAY
jgi:putative cofactor-binding repeat protein